jgi:hypothetical protein
MPTYDVDIEGTIYSWEQPTITVAQLRGLAGYAADQQMIEVDLKEGTEQVLVEDATIELKPGRGFAKKVVFKRG